MLRRETSEPRAAQARRRTGSGQVWGVGEACLPDPGAAAGHPALWADAAGRRGWADPADRVAGLPVRALWLPDDHRDAQSRRLAGGQGPGEPDLEEGGAEGTQAPAPESAAVAQRRLLRPAAGRARESHLEL